MEFINVEIKARTSNTGFIRDLLIDAGADHKGTDIQTDTYFNCRYGRLKLRQGNIENTLIHYHRPDSNAPKESDCSLMPVTDHAAIFSILSRSLGVLTSVTKTREIFYLANVKFHLDHLDEFGNFVEIEASNKDYPMMTNEDLHQQCLGYQQQFGIENRDLIAISYSDMILASTNNSHYLKITVPRLCVNSRSIVLR